MSKKTIYLGALGTVNGRPAHQAMEADPNCNDLVGTV